MTKAHSNLETTTCKDSKVTITERFYTIGYVPTGWVKSPNPKPLLTIKGCWLEQLGFTTRQPVIVEIEYNKLIIELAR